MSSKLREKGMGVRAWCGRASAWLVAAWLLLVAAPLLAGDVRVIDGDTLEWEGTKWRLSGIQAPELRPRPEPLAREATRALRALVAKGNVVCEGPEDSWSWDRRVGSCYVEGRDVAEELVREGLACRWARYDRAAAYAALDAEARSAGRGMWASGVSRNEVCEAD
jgi:endonuclease YncB( thermonuclease family)